MDERVCSTKPQPTDQDRLPPKRPRSVVVSSARFIVLLVGAIGYLLGLRAAMSSQPPAPVTVGFVQDMMAHHRQAVEIASWAKDRALDPEVRELAAEIESTASQQLETMRASLALLGAPNNLRACAWLGCQLAPAMSMITEAESYPPVSSRATQLLPVTQSCRVWRPMRNFAPYEEQRGPSSMCSSSN